jgi:hypothetical protein
MTDIAADCESLVFREQPLPVRRLVRAVASGWPVVVLAALSATVLATAVLRWLPAVHTATMVVGPISRNGASAMGARAPVAARSDIPLSILEFGAGDEVLSDFTRFLELLTSPAVAARLMAEPGLLAHLFPERWDGAAGRWQAPGGVIGSLRHGVLALAGREDWIEPTPEILSNTLRRLVVVQSMGANPMRRILYRDPDRGFALRLLTDLTRAADSHLRAEAARRANAQISYIRTRLATTTIAEYRHALADLLADQERVAMMIEVDLPFAADPIEAPSAASQPDWPNPLVILPLALGAGIGLGLFLVFLRAAWRDEPPGGAARRDGRRWPGPLAALAPRG